MTCIKKTKVFAHRANISGPCEHRENTIRAFEQTIGLEDLDGMELDVDQSSDGTLVVCNRTKDEQTGLNVDELRAKHADMPDFQQSLQCITQLLRLGNKNLTFRLDVEIKKNPNVKYEDTYERSVISALTEYLNPNRFLISSFDLNVLTKIKELEPNIETGILLKSDIDLKTVQDYIETPYVDVLQPRYNLFRRMRQTIVEAGKPIIIWTVNSCDLNEFIGDEAIYGIITDYAEEALNQRRALIMDKETKKNLKLYELAATDEHYFHSQDQLRVSFFIGLITAIVGALVFGAFRAEKPIHWFMLSVTSFVSMVVCYIALRATGRQYRRWLTTVSIRAKLENRLGIDVGIDDGKKEKWYSTEPIAPPFYLEHRGKFGSSESFIEWHMDSLCRNPEIKNSDQIQRCCKGIREFLRSFKVWSKENFRGYRHWVYRLFQWLIISSTIAGILFAVFGYVLLTGWPQWLFLILDCQ